MTRKLTKAEQFFFANAGYSRGADESIAAARARNARMLAYHEQRAKDACCSFEWSIDPDVTSADWCEPRRDGGKYRDPWATWQCVARDGAGRVFASLGGIDFGRLGEPWSNPYRRVVEAELASELDLLED